MESDRFEKCRCWEYILDNCPHSITVRLVDMRYRSKMDYCVNLQPLTIHFLKINQFQLHFNCVHSHHLDISHSLNCWPIIGDTSCSLIFACLYIDCKLSESISCRLLTAECALNDRSVFKASKLFILSDLHHSQKDKKWAAWFAMPIISPSERKMDALFKGIRDLRISD